MLPVLLILAAILINLMIGDFFGLRQLANSSPTVAAAKMLTVVQIIFGIITVSTVGIGSYVIWYAYRSLQCGVFPPLGAWIIEGAIVHTGNKARTLAWFQAGLGIVLIGAGCVVAYYAWGVLPDFLRIGKVAMVW